MRGRWLFALLVLLPVWDARASCEHDTAQIRAALSQESLRLRDSFFAELCAIPGGAKFVDVTDSDLGAGFQRPHIVKVATTDRGWTKGLTGTAWVALLIGEDGKVERAAVIESAGNKEADALAVTSLKIQVWQGGTLDGHPVRVLTYSKFSVKAK